MAELLGGDDGNYGEEEMEMEMEVEDENENETEVPGYAFGNQSEELERQIEETAKRLIEMGFSPEDVMGLESRRLMCRVGKLPEERMEIFRSH